MEGNPGFYLVTKFTCRILRYVTLFQEVYWHTEVSQTTCVNLKKNAATKRLLAPSNSR